jgi:putative peptidoglycan lipid II flippase
MTIRSIIYKLSSTVTGGAIIIAVTSIASRILGLVRDRLLASTFGGSGSLDPYFAAFKVPDLIFNVLVLGALSSSFIPVFVNYIKKDGDPGKEEAWRIANSVLNILVISLIAFGFLFYFLAPWIVPLIAPGFDAAQTAITIDLSRVMLIAILFFGISNVASGVLNAMKRFSSFAFAPVMYNLGIIAGIAFLTPR